MLTPGMILQDRYRITGTLGKGGMGAVYAATDPASGASSLSKRLWWMVTICGRRSSARRSCSTICATRRCPSSSTTSPRRRAVPRHAVHPGRRPRGAAGEERRPVPAGRWCCAGPTSFSTRSTTCTRSSRPIIHRDIKPQNLKLTPRGEVILLDFGLAKGFGCRHSTTATTSGSVFGYTPHYAPLEQIKGSGTDPRSDLYSLAATLYHLLTGVPPTDALTRAQSVMNGQADPLPALPAS